MQERPGGTAWALGSDLRWDAATGDRAFA